MRGTEPLCIGVLCGGQSPEHQISLLSARSFVGALDPKRYRIVLLWITPTGEWVRLGAREQAFLLEGDLQRIHLDQREFARPLELREWGVDVIFPLLHGVNGEDGTVQGLLQLSGVPYMGCSTLSAALGMNKIIAKRLLQQAQLPVLPFLAFQAAQLEGRGRPSYVQLSEILGPSFFVKPASGGSSIGVCCVGTESEFRQAVADGLQYDDEILFEKRMPNRREIECAVLGKKQHPEVSLPGEIVLRGPYDFYSYEAKYLDPTSTEWEIPPRGLSARMLEHLQELSGKTYEALACDGMARIDFFLNAEDPEEVYINEINTMPGFTPISMYPKLWAASGLSYGDLVAKLIELAFERHGRKQRQLVRAAAYADS